MFKITLLIHTILSATLAGTLVTVALVVGLTKPLALIGIAFAGLVVAWPVSHRIAKILMGGED